MHALERWRADGAVLLRLLRGMPGGATHASNLEAFYAPQAQDYDRFRERLLHGRAELIAELPLPDNAYVVELGGGTGSNLRHFGNRFDAIGRFDLVDLCPALLQRARQRLAQLPRVHVIEGDATTYRPACAVDVVYFSYTLSMIPDWHAALRNAYAMLKPGGVLGVVDFYHSAARPAAGLARHSALTRTFWRHWFKHDGVRLDPAHVQTLREMFPIHRLDERAARLPYVPLLRAPYYVFVGRKGA